MTSEVSTFERSMVSLARIGGFCMILLILLNVEGYGQYRMGVVWSTALMTAVVMLLGYSYHWEFYLKA